MLPRNSSTEHYVISHQPALNTMNSTKIRFSQPTNKKWFSLNRKLKHLRQMTKQPTPWSHYPLAQLFWSKTQVATFNISNNGANVVGVLPNRQYHVQIYGSGKITLRNRRHLWQIPSSTSTLIPTRSPNPTNDTTASPNPTNDTTLNQTTNHPEVPQNITSDFQKKIVWTFTIHRYFQFSSDGRGDVELIDFCFFSF